MKREPYSQRSNPGDPIYVRGRNARPPTRLATLVHSFNRHISTLSLSNFGRYHIPRSLFKLLFIFRCNIGQRKAQVRISAVELLVSMNSHLLPHGHLPFCIRHLPHRWSSTPASHILHCRRLEKKNRVTHSISFLVSASSSAQRFFCALAFNQLTRKTYLPVSDFTYLNEHTYIP